MKNLFDISLVLALVAVAGCTTPPPGNPATPPPGNTATPPPNHPTTPPPGHSATSSLSALERMRACVRDVNDEKKRRPTAEALKMLEDYRTANKVDFTNDALRLEFDYAVMNRCRTDRPPWYVKYDLKSATQTLFKVAPRIYGDKKVDGRRKYDALTVHCRFLCDDRRFDEALALAKKYAAERDAKGNEIPEAYRVLRSVYRLMGKYPEALATAKKMIEISSRKDGFCAEASKLAIEFDDVASVPGIWAMNDKNHEKELICWVLENQGKLDGVAAWRDGVADRALPFVANPKNGADARLSVARASRWMTEASPRGAAIRAALKDLPPEKRSIDWWGFHDLRFADGCGDWRHYAAVYPELADTRGLNDPKYRRAYVFSLAATGRAADAKAAALKYRDETGKPIERMRMDVLLAVIERRDALPVIEAAELDPKERAKAIRLAGAWALNLKMNDACRRYADAYGKMTSHFQPRRQNVAWSPKPLTGEAEWRALWPSLEKSFVDVKMYGGGLEMLDTDVATGRVAAEKTAKDSKDVRFEVTTLCDVRGLHVYLRAPDPNARLVEGGFAGGMGTEMYFAPGDNEPYICFGGVPTTPFSFLFDTTYTWKGHQRLVKDDAMSPFRLTAETWFSDTDYVEHWFFPWDAFYQKLPAAGTEWKFECLADGCSWGGSQSVHEASSWGRLVFNLKPGELTAIRRHLIQKHAKSWFRAESRIVARVDPFVRWADPVIGDPDFYKTSLKPLEDELRGYAKRVTPEMSDADVDDIYERAVPRWLGLKHEIDRLRREYLTKKSINL